MNPPCPFCSTVHAGDCRESRVCFRCRKNPSRGPTALCPSCKESAAAAGKVRYSHAGPGGLPRPCARCGAAPRRPDRRVCGACANATAPGRAEAARRASLRPRLAGPGAAPPPFLPGAHGLGLETLLDADAATAERARRVVVYAEQVERTGRIDYAAVPPAPVGPHIAPAKGASGPLRLSA